MPPPNLAEAFGVGAAAEQDPAVYCEGMRALGGSIDAALSYLMHTEHVGPREMAAFAETQELPAAQAAFLRFFCERARQMRMSTQILAERLQRDPDTQRVVLRELFQTEHEELSGPVRIEDEGFGVAVCFDGEDDYLSAYAGYVRATREEHEQVRESVRDTAGLATLGNLVPLSGPLRHMRGYVTFNLVGGDLGGEQMRIREHERQHKLNSLLLPEREITSLRKEGTPQTVAQAKDEIVAHLREGLSREAIIERLAVRNHPLYSYWRVPIDEARAHGCEEQAVHLEALEAEHIETVERLIEVASRAQAQGTTLTTLALTPWSRWRDLITEDTSTESTYN
ncbi:hypothetical protein GVX82_01345 [Patescibacteria group bacterium]|jgi:hypothetical protein|nr:hypothetical protein [Patescibacteria group bacterium]